MMFCRAPEWNCNSLRGKYEKHCCSLLVVLLSCLLASCGDDDYRYPSVKQDFLTAFSGMDGRLESVLTDEGERLRIVEGASGCV